MSHTDTITIGRVLELSGGKISYRDMAKQLPISAATAQRICVAHSSNPEHCRKAGSGRAKVLTDDNISKILALKEKNPKMSVPKLNKLVEKEVLVKVSDATLIRTLQNNNIHAYRSIAKLALSPKNVKKRFSLVSDWINYTNDY